LPPRRDNGDGGGEGEGVEGTIRERHGGTVLCYVTLCYVMCYVVVGDLLHFGRWQEQ